MKRTGAFTAAMTLLLCCSLAHAQEPRTVPASLPAESIHYGWADVLRVDPIYDDAGPAPTAPPREECYEEQVNAAPAPDTRAGSTVLGAIIGGVVGHSFGKGNGRTATTAVGAAAGAVVGNNVARDNEGAIAATERHCRIVESAAGPRHIVAYDVEYRYRGELYTARMNYDPGDRLRVRIAVTPAE
jgi:uncharacterized protein YcfJ